MRSYTFLRNVTAGVGLSFLSGCSNFNIEGSIALSYGDNQKIKRVGSSSEVTFKENEIQKDPFPLPYPMALGAEEIHEEDLPVGEQQDLNARYGVSENISIPEGSSIRSRKRTIRRY